ncbi:GntR family transcriptional regulator [Neorhizobium sp. DAR64860/K0K1]|uniref:GntR family transcriptional regulator n=1 Tax=Neorhizobium sp. DAR64860/K0K1 TaxID=3421955 RepID=UPI003D278FFA
MKSLLDEIIGEERPRFKTATEFVVETLRQAILSGRLPAGTPLRQDDLAEEFKLSRMPIREALRRLEADGLIDHQPHKGAVVASMEIDDIREVFEMRVMAECTALEISIPNIQPKTIEELSQLLVAMDDTYDPDRLSDLNRRFHGALYSSANRPRLIALVNSLHDSVDRYIRFLLINLDYHERSQKDHYDIFEAAKRGDVKTASSALRQHLTNGKEEVLEFLESRKSHPGLTEQ